MGELIGFWPSLAAFAGLGLGLYLLFSPLLDELVYAWRKSRSEKAAEKQRQDVLRTANVKPVAL